MANELPYFRFTVQAWQNGKIGIESYELKGLFIDLCGYYWVCDCHVTLTMLKKRFSNATSLLDELITLGIIKHENKHDKVEIDFLNFQYDLLSEKRKLRQAAGSKGGNAKAMLKQNGSYKDNNKDNNKDKDNIPSFEEFLEYAKSNKTNVDEESVKLKYESWKTSGWKTGGKTPRPIKNWKSTLLNTLPFLKVKEEIKNNRRQFT